MDLQPYYGERPLVVSDVHVKVRSSDEKRIKEIVVRLSKEITAVNNDLSFTAARRGAGELKAVLKEIYNSKRSAKGLFEAILAAIEDRAKELNAPIQAELDRITDLLTGYVKILEQKQKEQEKIEREKKEAEERAHQDKMRALEAQGKAQAAQLAQLQHDLDNEVAAMNMEPQKGLVPGGRVTHPHKFRLVDPAATVKAGCIRLLRIELDALACQDAVRAQLEIAPDQTPTLPGIEITQETTVTIKASSRIT